MQVKAGLLSRGVCVWSLGNPPCIEALVKRVEFAGRADLGSDLFLVWDGLFGEHRHFVALLGTSVPRTVRGCYKWWYQSMVHDHAREQGFLKRFIESKRSRKNYLSIEVMVTLCNVLEVMSDWFVDDEGSWFSTGQEWTVESGSSSSEPSSNSEHWIVVTDLEQQTLTDHDSSIHYPEEERVVPSTQIIEISSGETTPNSWDRDSPPSVLPHIPMPHVFAPGGGVYPYMPTEDNPTDYVYPFITTGVESNDPAVAVQVNSEVFTNQPEEPDTPEPTWEDYLGHQNVSPTYWTRKLNEIAGYTSSMEHGEGSIPQDQGEANAMWCTMYGEQDAPNSVAGNEYQIPDLNQTTEEGTGENEWPQDDEGLNLARRWDEIIATELENLRTEGNGQEQMCHAKGEGLPEDCEDESPSTVSSHATMRSMWKDGTS
ncbi:unnamed protein product [Microthlaspi erraticum]|uniref:Uncharacterized protein n=1 Tax=Microthlaspi erraticum TaxID=1685480 RepID=A0A6D2K7M5_9BRAS|nr:unnamed protein product [Microthlaspi erraticum]